MFNATPTSTNEWKFHGSIIYLVPHSMRCVNEEVGFVRCTKTPILLAAHDLFRQACPPRSAKYRPLIDLPMRFSSCCKTVYSVLRLISTWAPNPKPASLSQEVLNLRISTRDWYLWKNNTIIRDSLILQYPGSNATPGFLRLHPPYAGFSPQGLRWKTRTAF